MGWEACRWELIGAWAGVATVEVVRNGWVLSVPWSCNWQDLLTYWTWYARERVVEGTQVISPVRNPVLPQSSYLLWIPGGFLLFLVTSCLGFSPIHLLSPSVFVCPLWLSPLSHIISFWQFTILHIFPSGIRCLMYFAHFLVLVVSGRRINPALKMRVLARAYWELWT